MVGSAERRRRGAVVEHGSVLLAGSACAPELPGIGELAGGSPTAVQLAEAMAVELSLELGLAPELGELSPAERAAAECLAGEKYGRDAWNRRR